jgi:hypothetical protein
MDGSGCCVVAPDLERDINDALRGGDAATFTEGRRVSL